MKKKIRIRTDETVKWGPPAKFKGQEYCDLLIKLFCDGEGTPAFCDEADICETTFFLWLDKYPEFAAAYKIALQKGRRKWEKIGLRKDVNPTIWRAIMRNRFHYDKVRIRGLAEGASAVDRIKTVWQGVEQGTLDPNEANKLAQLAISQVQIEDRVPISTSNPIPKDELMTQIATIKAVMDAQDKEKE